MSSVCGRLGLCLLVLCIGLSCSDDTTSDSGVDAGVDMAKGEAGGDQGPKIGKLVVTVHKKERARLGDHTTEPAEGAMVAADLPGGTRTELTTGADGKVTFDNVDWSKGTAAVTAYAPGYQMISVTGVTQRNEMSLGLRAFRTEQMVRVSGTAKNMDPSANYLAVMATVLSDRYETNNSDFSLNVQAGQPFTLYGTNATWGKHDNPQKPRDIQVVRHGWTKASHSGATQPIALDLDFATKETPVKVTGSMVFPATAKNLLGGAWRVQWWINQQVRGLLLGNFTKMAEQSQGTFDWEGEYLNIPEAKGVHTIYYARMSKTDWRHGSHVRIDGYPKDGTKVEDFLDTPELVKPSTTTMKLTDPIEWKTSEAAARPMVTIHDTNGRTLWAVMGAAGTTSMTLPALPSTAGEALATSDQKLTGRVELCADMDDTNKACYRWAGGELFSIQPPVTTTATTTGRIVEIESGKLVEGAKVCVKDEATIPCATTDAKGYFILPGLPVDKDVILTIEKSGYFTAAFPRGKQVPIIYNHEFVIVPTAQKADMEAKLGQSLDAAKGQIVVVVHDKVGRRVPGATVAISPATVAVYGDDAHLLNPSLTATSSVGWGMFVNQSPGQLEVTAKNAAGLPCAVGFGWKGSSNTIAKVTAIADTFTVTTFRCP